MHLACSRKHGIKCGDGVQVKINSKWIDGKCIGISEDGEVQVKFHHPAEFSIAKRVWFSNESAVWRRDIFQRLRRKLACRDRNVAQQQALADQKAKERDAIRLKSIYHLKSTKQRREQILLRRAAKRSTYSHWSNKPHDERFAPVVPMRLMKSQAQLSQFETELKQKKFKFDPETYRNQEAELFQRKRQEETESSQIRSARHWKSLMLAELQEHHQYLAQLEEEKLQERETLHAFDPRISSDMYTCQLTESPKFSSADDYWTLSLPAACFADGPQSFDIRISTDSSLLSVSTSSFASETSFFDCRSDGSCYGDEESVELRESDELRYSSDSNSSGVCLPVPLQDTCLRLADGETVSIIDTKTGLMRLESGPKSVYLTICEQVF